jgi:hypothetical protein
VRRDHNLTVRFKAEVDARLPGGGGRSVVRQKIRPQHQSAGGEDGAEEGPPVHGEEFDSHARAAMFLVRFAGQARDFGSGERARCWFSGAGKLVP